LFEEHECVKIAKALNVNKFVIKSINVLYVLLVIGELNTQIVNNCN